MVRFSRFDRNVVGFILILIAFMNHPVSGYACGRVWILVIVRSTFVLSLMCGGCNSVSISMALVDVVLKQPRITFIASLWTPASFIVWVVFGIWDSSLV